MSWSDFLFIPSGNQTSDEAAANLDRQKTELNARLAAREQSGTISDQQDASYRAAAGTTLLNQDQGTWDAFLNDSAYRQAQHDNGADADQPSTFTDLVIDVLALAVLLGGIWLFGSFGGFLWARQLVSKKNTVGMIGLGAGVALWAYGLYHYGAKTWKDVNSIKDQGLSLFGL